MGAALLEPDDLIYEPRIMPRAGGLMWALNYPEDGVLKQRMCRADEMVTQIDNAQGQPDRYMSQAYFSRPRRRATHVALFTHTWVDLDIYNSPEPLDAGEQGEHLVAFCEDHGIPTPSLIIDSGRGIYCKWLFTAVLPGQAATKLVRVNRELVKKFGPWFVDRSAVDASRILRIVGSINSKSGRPVRIIADTGHRYDFDRLADAVLPMSRAALKAAREAGAARKAERAAKEQVVSITRERARRDGECAPAKKSPRSWQWAVLDDLRTLVRLRWGGVVPAGQRDIFGHIGASMLGQIFENQPERLWAEIQTFAGLLLPDDYRTRELHGHSSTLLRRVEDGRGSYQYRAETIIDRLGITSAEMQDMKVLIDRDEKEGRRRRKRRRDGRADRPHGTTGHDRAEWRVQVATGSAAFEKPWEAAGVSRATWYRQQAAKPASRRRKGGKTPNAATLRRTKLVLMGRARDKAAFGEYMYGLREYWTQRVEAAQADRWSAEAQEKLDLAMRSDFARCVEYYKAGAEGRPVKKRKSTRRPPAQVATIKRLDDREWREYMDDLDAMMEVLAA
ncbi:hypothetical protein AAC691_17235 [Nguyenibacter vanlangensis]|uniref:RepB-like DNA primase domain-containing protein n=1 Tax=Nguyenibacter vanlangensis TaxID=1216886 RepID=A0ABZ3D2L6_9PROT